MSTTSIRTAVARRFIDLLRTDGALANVEVSYGYPRDDGVGPDPRIFVVIADGGNTTTHMKAGRKPRDDEWDMRVVILLTHDDDENGLGTAESVEAVFAAVENLCAANPTLQKDANGITGLEWVKLEGESNGPIIRPLEAGNFEGAWDALVACRARLS